MYFVVLVLRTNGLHGLVKLSAPILVHRHLDVCQYGECDLGVKDGDSVRLHSCCIFPKCLNVRAALLLEKKLEADDLEKLFKYICPCWPIGSCYCDGGGDNLVKLVIVDPFVIGAIGCA